MIRCGAGLTCLCLGEEGIRGEGAKGERDRGTLGGVRREREADKQMHAYTRQGS